MGLHSTLRQSRGFTLVEILIAIGIFAVIFALGLFISFDFYKSYSFGAERNIIVSILQKARSQSLNNIDQARHGVHFEMTPFLRYTIFKCPINNPQCTDYTASSTDIVVDSSYGISFITPTPALPFNIIFSQLNGSCVSCQNSDITIRVGDGTKFRDIKINSEGRVDW